MSRREDVDNSIWSDPEFAALSPEAKTVYLWSFTNPRCGMAGLYKVPAGTAAFEVGLTPEQEQAALKELQRTRFAYYVDGVVWVRSRVKHLRTRGEHMAKSIVKDVDMIDRRHPLRHMFAAEYGESWLQKALEKFGLDQAILESPCRTPTEVQGLGTGQGLGLGKGHRVGERNGVPTTPAGSVDPEKVAA